MRAMAIEGKTVTEIAQEVGLSRQQASKILNSEEMKKITREAESRIYSLVHRALDTYSLALQKDEIELSTAVKVATSILKSIGIINDKAEQKTELPEPFIIHRLDGSREILGYKYKGEEIPKDL